MFLIRDARPADLDDLLAVARHLNSVNLPNDRDRLRSLIAASQESFAARCDVADRRFLFVLTDTSSGRVVGSSMIFAQHGSRPPAACAARFVIAAEGAVSQAEAEPQPSLFRALLASAVVDGDLILVASADRQLLGIAPGSAVACLPVDAPRPTRPLT